MQWKGLPMVVLASLALFFCGEDKLFDGPASDVIDRTDGLMFLLFFVIFMVYPFGMSRQSSVRRWVSRTSQTSRIGLTSLTILL